MEIIFACSIGSIKLEKASGESLYCSFFYWFGFRKLVRVREDVLFVYNHASG